MQRTPESKIPDDEIDIKSIGGKVYSFFAYPVSLLASNIKTTLLFFLIAVLLSVSSKYLITKTYKSSFIIRPNDKHERFHVKLLTDIQVLLENHDFKTIAKELKIDPSVAAQIAEMKITNPTAKITLDSINYTEVTLEIKDYNQFIPIQNSMINYLENSPYFTKIKDLQRKLIELNLVEVEKDVLQLDSLKKLQLANYGKIPLQVQNTLLMSDLINPTAIYTTAVERINKKSSLMAQQQYMDNFQLIKSCVVANNHHWPPRILIMCLYLIPCFMLACIMLLHFRTRKKFRD